MTTMQVNTEIFRGLSVIAEDEGLMKRAARYISKLARQKEEADETLMTKEEFFAKIDRSLEQARRGETQEMRTDETLDDFMRRVRYV